MSEISKVEKFDEVCKIVNEAVKNLRDGIDWSFKIHSTYGELEFIHAIMDNKFSPVDICLHDNENKYDIMIEIPKSSLLLRARVINGVIRVIFATEVGVNPQQSIIDGLVLSYLETVDDIIITPEDLEDIWVKEFFTFFQRICPFVRTMLNELVRARFEAADKSMAYAYEICSFHELIPDDKEFKSEFECDIDASIESIRYLKRLEEKEGNENE